MFSQKQSLWFFSSGSCFHCKIVSSSDRRYAVVAALSWTETARLISLQNDWFLQRCFSHSLFFCPFYQWLCSCFSGPAKFLLVFLFMQLTIWDSHLPVAILLKQARRSWYALRHSTHEEKPPTISMWYRLGAFHSQVLLSVLRCRVSEGFECGRDSQVNWRTSKSYDGLFPSWYSPSHTWTTHDFHGHLITFGKLLPSKEKIKKQNKQTYQKRNSVALSTIDPFISSFVDSIRKKLHECFVFILELKFRIWWNYLCVILVHMSEAFQVTDGPNLTILKIFILIISVFPIFLTSWKRSHHYNGGPRWAWEVPELMELYSPEGCWEVCTFVFIHFIFLHFSALLSKVA